MAPSTTYLSGLRMPRFSTNHLRTSLRSFRGLGTTTTRLESTPENKPFASTRSFGTFPRLATRHFKPVFSKTGSTYHANRTPIASVLILTSSVAIGIFVYNSSRNPFRMDYASYVTDSEAKYKDAGQTEKQVSLVVDPNVGTESAAK